MQAIHQAFLQISLFIQSYLKISRMFENDAGRAEVTRFEGKFSVKDENTALENSPGRRAQSFCAGSHRVRMTNQHPAPSTDTRQTHQAMSR